MELVAPLWEGGNIEAACDKLVKESVMHWRKVRNRQEDEVVDDITLVIAFLAV